jgi:hypothetical protein
VVCVASQTAKQSLPTSLLMPSGLREGVSLLQRIRCFVGDFLNALPRPVFFVPRATSVAALSVT